jgi:Na+/H+ antiporter NhaC
VVTCFSLAVAAMVGLLSRSGATRSLVERVAGLARGRRGAMVASWLAGVVVFFDDYANCLVVGSSMGPLCDRFGVSRQKLAYIVDSTAAPVASLALVSTWVGYEVGQISDALGPNASISAFELFLQALPYRFYCILTLVMVGVLALTGRDFGPMAAAEEQAYSPRPLTPSLEALGRAPWWVAASPLVLLIGLTFGLMFRDGRAALGERAADARLFEILGAVTDPFGAMLSGSLAALAAALVLVLITRALPLAEAGRGVWIGLRSVGEALLVLYLAWTLGSVIEACGAGAFLQTLLANRLDPRWLPALTFLLAAATSLSTGSSFFTMGALIPLVLPLALRLEGGEATLVVIASTAAVLDGAVFGDHASPISDATVLSALGAGCDVISHVRTQLPYALTAGAAAVVCGAVPVGFGVPWWAGLLLGCGLLVAFVLLMGKPPQATPASAPPATAG